LIVVDASLAIEVVARTALGESIAPRLLAAPVSLAAPHLLDLEVTQALRRAVLGGDMTEERARQALTDFSDLPVTRYSLEGALSAIWDLRHNVTAYDAAYVVLTDLLDGILWTCDGRLARAVSDLIDVEDWSASPS
jgi:predicted nucleic acid-binding protein